MNSLVKNILKAGRDQQGQGNSFAPRRLKDIQVIPKVLQRI